jgi:hypothetical protein
MRPAYRSTQDDLTEPDGASARIPALRALTPNPS